MKLLDPDVETEIEVVALSFIRKGTELVPVMIGKAPELVAVKLVVVIFALMGETLLERLLWL